MPKQKGARSKPVGRRSPKVAPGRHLKRPSRTKAKRKHDTSARKTLETRNEKLTALLDVATAMTAERDLDSLLNLIVAEAAHVVAADRCSLWILDAERDELWTKVAHGLDKGEKIRIPMGVGIAGQVAQTGNTINILDAYADARFNRDVDRATGYRTHTILGVPMWSQSGEVTGVLQALNKKNRKAGPFTSEDEELLLALGATAAVAIENAILLKEIDRLFEGFVRASVVAIESRDPTTSGHSERVALLTLGIAEHVEHVATGPYADTTFSREDMREIRYAALLHDFGKVGVREHVLVKANKLYPHELENIETRFRMLRAERECCHLRRAVQAMQQGQTLPPLWRETIQAELDELDDILAFINVCNRPTVLESGGFERLRELQRKTHPGPNDTEQPILQEAEIQRLSIPRGSLDAPERLEIESHVTHTFRFLSQIPWTRNLRRVPDFAYAHHEKLNGQGYPRQLVAEHIPVQARMMAIADIYDALTASDRPYKKAVPHQKALEILNREAGQGMLDTDLLEVFIEARVFQRVLQGDE